MESGRYRKSRLTMEFFGEFIVATIEHTPGVTRTQIETLLLNECAKQGHVPEIRLPDGTPVYQISFYEPDPDVMNSQLGGWNKPMWVCAMSTLPKEYASQVKGGALDGV